MPRIDSVKRIKIEDFPEDQQELGARIAEIYNFFAEQVTNTLNGNVDFENVTDSILTFEVTVNSSGTPIDNNRFLARTGLQGVTVINAANLTNSVTFPTGTPFISFTSSGTGIYTINNISNLPANNKFRLTLRLI